MNKVLTYLLFLLMGLITHRIFLELFTDNNPSVHLPLITPSGVHITKSSTLTTITWSLSSKPETCIIQLPSSTYNIPHYNSFIYSYYIYKISIKNSLSSESFTIQCSLSGIVSSKTFQIIQPPAITKLLFLGDFSTSKVGDSTNPQHTQRFKPNILPLLLKDYKNFTAIWHLGDIAYDLFSNSGARGQEFLKDIEAISAEVPYIAVVGNHEVRNRFRDFLSLFADGLFFIKGFPEGNVIAICSEFDYYQMKPLLFPYGHATSMYLKQKQKKWLLRVLRAIDRKKQPWLIVTAHKPLYCSKDLESEMVTQDCELQAKIMRENYEEIFVKFNVDIGFFGHVHLYERTLPVKFGKVEQEYKNYEFFMNPAAPIYIVNGVAGNLEAEDIKFQVSKTPDTWVATMKENLGYGALTIFNKTHLKYEQIGCGDTQWDDPHTDLYASRRIDDSFWIIKTSS